MIFFSFDIIRCLLLISEEIFYKIMELEIDGKSDCKCPEKVNQISSTKEFGNNINIEDLNKFLLTNLLASSSLSLASNSLLGGYSGRLDGSHA